MNIETRKLIAERILFLQGRIPNHEAILDDLQKQIVKATEKYQDIKREINRLKEDLDK